ncbi:MAG: GDSL-type esterase/lipase family protein [Thermosynechococcaceae cyanobacterium]
MQTVSFQSIQAKAPVLKSHVPLKIVVLGDSLVYGYGDPEGGGWVERLRRQGLDPDRSGPIFYNLGVRGDTVVQTAQRFEAELKQRGEIRHRIPDRLILSVGVNDSARVGHGAGRHRTDFAEFQAILAQLLDRAMHLCPTLFIGMIPVNQQKMPFLDAFYFNHEDQFLYKEVTQLACQERQVPYLDTFERWRHRGQHWCNTHLCHDGLHPNTQGYQALLADIVGWEPYQNAIAC